MDRRKFLKAAGTVTAAAYFSQNISGAEAASGKPTQGEATAVFEFPPLPFAYNALEPYFDARTMEIHYDKHHRAYYTNFMNAIRGTDLESRSMEEIFSSISQQSEAVRNNGGGYFNHLFFWNSLAAGSPGPSAELLAAFQKSFGSLDKFRESFTSAAKTRFGSGWAWLYIDSGKNLAVTSTANQDNTLMDISPVRGIPLLALDVWEHAYYLKYQNRRPEYIDAFWNVVNWNEVNKRYQQALKV